MLYLAILHLSLLASDAHAAPENVPAEKSTRVEMPCSDQEKWFLSSEKTPQWFTRYQDYLNQKSSPLYGFSQAVHLKRLSALLPNSDFEHDFSEFWVGRILYQLKFDPLAFTVFQSIFENSPTPSIRKAAFVCMAEIQKRSPDWAIPLSNVSNLPLTAQDADAIFLLSMGGNTHFEKLLTGAHKDFIEGMTASKKKNYSTAIQSFGAFLQEVPQTHPLLSRYIDHAHLFLGHALYSVAKFDEASDHFQKVKKTSNLQIDALSDLSWSYLLSHKYSDSIGLSMQLRTGGLRHAFAPEPIMVAAMALNELCSYPDSIRMIQAFITDYGKSYEWLYQHQKDDNLYPELVAAIRSKSSVPSKVTAEWMKNPSFLAEQIELNRLIDHPKKLASVMNSGANEQEVLTRQFIEKSSKFMKEVRVAKLKLKPGEELAASYSDQFLVLKRELRNLTHFYKASKIWKKLAHNYEGKIPTYKSGLISRINKGIREQNVQMLAALNKVRDNSDLIEVEIYNGASQDLIWKNAHPDFEKLSDKFEKEQAKERAEDAAKTWNWGRFLASDIENAEVWEDELGTLKADLTDQCGKKEKFLQVQMRKR